MIRKDYNFTWDSFFRCQFADDEIVQLMKESGCSDVFLGIESGSQKILDNMHKNTTIAKYLKGMELLKKYEIDFTPSFIIGFPGETEQTLQETLQFIARTEPDWISMCTWYCSRFTPIWQQKNEYNLQGSEFNWSHSTMNVQQACDWLEKIYLSLNKTVHLPHFDFNASGKTQLLHLGMSKSQIKDFVDAFNMGVKEKLKNPSQPEISEETVKTIKAALGKDN
jgi:histone acetyltransferase (RNA polymerase elongator complex component)